MLEVECVRRVLSRQGPLGEDRGDSVGSLLSLQRIEQHKRLHLTKLFQQLLHRQARPDCLVLLVKVLRQRKAQQAVERVHPDLAVGLVVRRSEPRRSMS